jgi:hypothetical protein
MGPPTNKLLLHTNSLFYQANKQFNIVNKLFLLKTASNKFLQPNNICRYKELIIYTKEK